MTTASPAAEIDAAAHGATKPVLAVMLGHEDGPILPGSAVPTFSFPESAAAALGRMRAYATWRATEATMVADELDAAVDPATGRALIAAALDGGDEQLGLADTWALLSAYGVGKTNALAYGIILQAVEIATALAMGMPALVREGMTWRDLRLKTLYAAPVELRHAARRGDAADGPRGRPAGGRVVCNRTGRGLVG